MDPLHSVVFRSVSALGGAAYGSYVRDVRLGGATPGDRVFMSVKMDGHQFEQLVHVLQIVFACGVLHTFRLEDGKRRGVEIRRGSEWCTLSALCSPRGVHAYDPDIQFDCEALQESSVGVGTSGELKRLAAPACYALGSGQAVQRVCRRHFSPLTTSMTPQALQHACMMVHSGWRMDDACHPGSGWLVARFRDVHAHPMVKRHECEECVLCREAIQDADIVVVTTCGHVFHATRCPDCVEVTSGMFRWLLEHGDCPLCKHTLY